jgi:hypothetical protein
VPDDGVGKGAIDAQESGQRRGQGYYPGVLAGPGGVI